MAPAPKKIRLSAPGGVEVTWSDDHTSSYSYEYLRKRCPCATCRESMPQVVTEDDPFALVGKAPIKAVGAYHVGHYAISFRWNDGHSTGIYAHEYLREICPCSQCN